MSTKNIEPIVTAFLSGMSRRTPAPEVSHNEDGSVTLEWSSDVGLACLDIEPHEFRFMVSPYHGPQSRTYLMDGDIGVDESVESVIEKMARIPDLVSSRLFGA